MNSMIHTPVGVRDIYGVELQRKLKTMDAIHEQLSLFGYSDIETPVFEFLEVFSEKVGTTPVKDLYKFFDKDGNILCLRPDFTPSIARCAAKYFAIDNMPMRLCYKGRSFVNASEYQGKLKESTQMGVELIEPCNDAASDAEMISLMVSSLIAAGFKDFQISIGQIDYFKGVCEEANLNQEQIDILREYISVKNYFGAEDFLAKQNVSLSSIESILNVSDITTLDELKAVKEKTNSETAKKAIVRLEEIYEILTMSGYEKYVSFDLSLISRFNYYTGVIFRAYTYGVGDAIIKGGRYDNLLGSFGKESSAVGFVFLIDEIMSALNAEKIFKDNVSSPVWVVYNKENRKAAFALVNQYREKNVPAVAILFDNNNSKEDYKNYAKENCIKDVVFVMD